MRLTISFQCVITSVIATCLCLSAGSCGGGGSSASNAAPLLDSGLVYTTAEADLTPIVLLAHDPDPADELEFSIVGGVDAGLFVIDSLTGEIRFRTIPDCESPEDNDADNAYEISIQISDGKAATTKGIVIKVADVNEYAPSIQTTSISINEGVLEAGHIAAEDRDHDAEIVYSISGGADAPQFQIHETSGRLAFRDAADFDVPSDDNKDNIFECEITVFDGIHQARENIVVHLVDTNDLPPIIRTTGEIAVLENERTVQTIDVDDDLTRIGLSFSIASGDDASHFEIDGTSGVLRFGSPPDCENPADANGDGIYEVVVLAADSAWSHSAALSVAVTDVNEFAPVLAAIDSSLVVLEGQSSVLVLNASDQDLTAELEFSLVGGIDAPLFSVDRYSGNVSFLQAPDFEKPTDADADNSYEVMVAVSDGSLSDTELVAIAVENVNERPRVLSSYLSVCENDAYVGVVDAEDSDEGDVLAYFITGGVDKDFFRIDQVTGDLEFLNAPDFESPRDIDLDNDYKVQVAVSDGHAMSVEQLIVVQVEDVNEFAPVITTSSVFRHSEYTKKVVTLTAADGDSGDALIFSLAGGDDVALFSLDETGNLCFVDDPAYETPMDFDGDNEYTILVSVGDGIHTVDCELVIAVVDQEPFWMPLMQGGSVPNKLTGIQGMALGSSWCALRYDGTIAFWGELDDPYDGIQVPVGLADVMQIAAGENHYVARLRDGRITMWGDGRSGQLDAPYLRDVVDIACGWSHSLALRGNGTVVAWGANGAGQIDVPASLDDVVQVAAGGDFSLALRRDGTVVGWGDNGSGQASPPEGLNGVAQIAAGGYFGVARKNDGSLVFWGSTSGLIPSSPGYVYQIAAGYRHWVARSSRGIIAQGANNYQQCNVPDGLLGVVQVSASRESSCAVMSDGSVVTWGGYLPYEMPDRNNDFRSSRQVGFGSNEHGIFLSDTGHPIGWGWSGYFENLGSIEPASDFSVGNFHQVFLHEDGSVSVNGGAAPPVDLGIVVQVSAGGAYCAVLQDDGTVRTWGDEFGGETDVPFGVSDVAAVEAGDRHVLALKADGTVVGWGNNERGQIDIPAGLSGVVQLAATNLSSLALKADGTVVNWGNPLDVIPVTMPDNLVDVVKIDGGVSHYLACTRAGEVFAWGDNLHGACVVPGGISGVVDICADGNQSFIRSDRRAPVHIQMADMVVRETGEPISMPANVEGYLAPITSKTYNGSPYAPRLPGIYSVEAIVDCWSFRGYATATLTIIPATDG